MTHYDGSDVIEDFNNARTCFHIYNCIRKSVSTVDHNYSAKKFKFSQPTCILYIKLFAQFCIGEMEQQIKND